MNKNIVSGTGLILAALLFVATIILVNASFTSMRIDLTENKLFTLSEGTLNILDQLDEPIRLDLYFSQKAMTGLPALSNYGIRVRDMLLEYKSHADGMIELNIIDPETFSEEEDQAVASGLQGIAVNQAGDRAYLGIIGTNSTDDEKVIPFVQPGREDALEYDITKMIYNLAYPRKPLIGIISTLPVFGGPPPEGSTAPDIPPWIIINTMKEFFDVRELDIPVDAIDSDVDVLMIIHPKNLKQRTLYAIDQFILAGGKAMVFVDPLAEQDQSQGSPENTMVMPDIDSDLDKLFEKWGLEMIKEKVAGDINAAMHVQARGPRGPREVAYLPWLRLAGESFNKKDFATSELNIIHMGTAGILKKKDDSNIEFTPLIQTTKQAMQLERDFLMIQRDPSVILDNFKSDETTYTLAVRLQGHAESAFPEGNTLEEDTETAGDSAGPVTATGNHIPAGDLNVIAVSDTDILADLFWIRNQSFFGVDIPQPIADNGNFIVNSLENLSGSSDLINLRSRGKFSRPFERVDAIRRDAELKYREREQELQQKLQETEQKIMQIQQEHTGQADVILTPEQAEEIEKFRQIRVNTRKELRAVQHELKKNIEALGAKLRIINIGLIPLIVILISIATGVYRISRKRV